MCPYWAYLGLTTEVCPEQVLQFTIQRPLNRRHGFLVAPTIASGNFDFFVPRLVQTSSDDVSKNPLFEFLCVWDTQNFSPGASATTDICVPTHVLGAE